MYGEQPRAVRARCSHPPTTSSALLALLAVCAASLVLLAAPAHADPSVVVRLTVERIRLTGGDDGCGDPDWYVKVFINGQVDNNEDTPSQDANEGDPDISPNWEFSRSVDLATLADAGRIPVSVELWEEDGGLCFEDDQFDASQSAGDAISGTAIAAPCGAALDGRAITCGTSEVFAGTGGDRAEVTLRVDVDEPPSAPGLRIRCMHSPAWPQPGAPVTITATALDGSLASLIADRLEIWVQPNTADGTSRSRVVDLAGVATATYTFTPDPALPDFAYGCRLTKSGTSIFSSWHRTRVAGTDNAVPILYTGPSASRLDIVFIADNVTYSSPTDPTFLADVVRTINISYYGFDQFLIGQDKFNFWLASDMGRADDVDGGCDHDLPSGWDDDYAFADAGAIIHRQSQRDCALRDDRIFSGTLNLAFRSDGFQVVTHETGHQPFGLADEYCCDGGYFQTEAAPNVYEELSPGNELAASPTCIEDAAALGRVAGDCREWDQTVENWFDPDFASSEPASTDIMNDNANVARAADIRRYNLIFAGCQAAGC